MILQRYNTFQSHWQRICREIENGTYKRHLYRAERRMSTVPATVTRTPEPEARAEDDFAIELAELDKEFAPPPLGVRASPAPPAAHAARPPPPIPMPTPPPKTAVAMAPPMGGRSSTSPLLGALATPFPRMSVPAGATAPPTSGATAPPGAGASVAPKLGALPPPRPPPAPRSGAPAPGSLPAPTAPPARRDDALPEYRVRQLYVEYVEAKRRQKESTAAITYDSLAESLRASSTKLRQKHGKTVDFEVAIRDGKAVLRPRIK
jgi:hypothetical protein